MKREQSAIESMTGFGTAEGDFNAFGQDYRLRAELKSLNHRSLDVKTRLPRELLPLESLIKAEFQAKFSRGSIDANFELLEKPQTTRRALSLNEEYLEQMLGTLEAIRIKYGIPGQIEVKDLLGLPELFNRRTASVQNVEAQWVELKPILHQAMSGLKLARTQEGQTLTEVLRKSAGEIRAALQSIETKRATSQNEMKRRTREKLDRLFDTYPIKDQPTQTLMETRVAQEIAFLLDRTDIQEELVRFSKHLDQLDLLLKGEGLVGRKMDFTLQEMGREINTLGNKAQEFSISEDVVQVKVRLEQIREQCMNLE